MQLLVKHNTMRIFITVACIFVIFIIFLILEGGGNLVVRILPRAFGITAIIAIIWYTFVGIRAPRSPMPNRPKKKEEDHVP